jgi:hypothetical protein
MATFREYLKQIVPTVFQGSYGSRLTDAIGMMFDMVAESSRLGVKCWMIRSVEMPPDGLALHGLTRQLPRWAGESHAAYAQRLQKAWDMWAQAGTKQAIITQLAGLGLVASTKENFEWIWDDGVCKWTRFWVVITGHPWSAWKIGQTGYTIGGGQMIGSTATAAERDRVIATIRQWKGAHTLCDKVIVVMDSLNWPIGPQPDGSWDMPQNRSPYAIYWDGTR